MSHTKGDLGGHRQKLITEMNGGWMLLEIEPLTGKGVLF